MAQIRIGKIRFTVDGVWNSATTYSMLSTVTNSALTKVYVSKVDDNTNHNPDEDTQGTYWQPIVDAATAADNATRKVVVPNADASETLEPNIMYEFGTCTTLDVTLSTPESESTDFLEWQFSFNSGSTATTFSVPVNVAWVVPVTMEANTHYEVNIIYDTTNEVCYGIIVGWDYTPSE